MSKTIFIGGRLESKEKGNVVTGANAILDDTKGKKQNVINKETDDELLRLEQSKQDNLTFDNVPTEDSTNPVTSGGVYTAEKALSDAIEAILLLIPSAATALNKLVDTNTMNSSISTATATFRGTYNAVSDLGLTYQATHAQIEAALDALGLTADNNDYAFVQVPVSDQSQDIAKTERYKNNGTNWQYEYDLNTSGFTSQQWAAINSGITVALVTKLTDLPTAAALQLALNTKQDTLTFDTEPTELSQNPVTSGGIYTAIQAIATALSDYSTTTDGRLGALEGLIPSEAASNNKLTDKAYVDGLIQAITELIPAEATTSNQLADKAYVLASILAATPAFKGQFTTLAELQAVASPKDGDLGIVRTKDSDGMDVFTDYQYLSNAWNVFYSLSYHPQTKPATTGTTGDYPYNGMGRVELAKNMVNTGTELEPVMVNQLTQDMFYKGAVGSRVPNTNTIFVIRYDYVLAENITIPSGCVLEFDGGSLSGAYTITGQNTGIQAGLLQIFNINVILAGTWKLTEVFPEWFGAKNDKTYNSTVAFQKCLDICKNGGLVKISSGEFLLDTLYFKFGKDCHLEGSGTGATILRMNSAPLITVEDYESTPHTTDGSSYGNFSIRARDGQSDEDVSNVCIKHTRIRHGHIHDIDLLQGEAGNSKVYALIELYGDFTYNTYIDRIRCDFGHCKYGIKTTAKDNNVYNNSNIVNIRNCLFYSNTMEACVDMACCTQYEIKGCLFEDCGNHAIILGQAGDIRGNWIEAFNDSIIVFQNNLGTLASARNNIGENYFASSAHDIHVPADCDRNSIKGIHLLAPAKVVKDTNSINVDGLHVSEPTITVPSGSSFTATKQSAEERFGVWQLDYVVQLPSESGSTSGNVELTINTTELSNVKAISASAYDVWGNVNFIITPVAVRGKNVTLNVTDNNPTMLTVYVEFC